MLKKGFAIVTLIILYVFSPFSPANNALAQAPDDLATQLSSDQGTLPAESEVTPYTAEEFAGLPDDQKRDVYLNSPELLPPGFDPNVYQEIFYSNPEN